MKIKLKRMSDVRGLARHKLLAPEAAEALEKVERAVGGLTYHDMYRTPIEELTAITSASVMWQKTLISYSGFSYGLSIRIDLDDLIDKKLSMAKFCTLMAKNDWYCRARDEDVSRAEASQFNYMGPLGTRHLIKASYDPATWNTPVEEMIYEKYGKDFTIDFPAVQKLLKKSGFDCGDSGVPDVLSRTAISAFQRAWGLPVSGTSDMRLCRVIAFVNSEVEIVG